MNKFCAAILLFFSFQTTFAQTFLNGDFENNTAGFDQINMSNAAFNSTMANTTAFGTYGDMDIITSPTYCGLCQSGLWYTSLTGSATDAIAMELSAPLVAGNSYTISFWDKGCWGTYSTTGPPVEIGVSNSSTSFGTSVYNAPNPLNGTWVQRTFTFTAPISGLYITVQLSAGGLSDWTQIDNFTFSGCILNLNLGNDTTVCSGSILTLNAANSGATYVWQDGSTDSTFTVTQAGTYYVDVTGASCSVTDTIQVSIFNPAAPVINSNSPLCEGSNLNLTTTAVAGATYNWTGPNGWTSNVQNPTINSVTVANSGNYSLIISINGCSSLQSTANVVVTPMPAAPVLSSNSPFCEGSDLNLTSTFAAGGTISWSGPNLFSSTLQNPNVTAATIINAGNYSATVTLNGCTSAPANINVIINQSPSTPVAGSNSPVCEGGDILLTASSTAGATYNWTGPSAWSSVTQNPSILNAVPNQSGNYDVYATLNGCNSPTAAVTVVVVPVAALTFTASPDDMCAGDVTTITLTSASIAGAVYNLTVNPGSITSGAGSGPWTAQYNTTGTFDIILGGIVGNCVIAPDTQSVTVHPMPIVNFTPNITPFCDSVIVNFSNLSTEIGTVNWNFGDGTTDTALNPTHTYYPGSYDVTLTVTSPFGCSNTLTVPAAVVVDAPPVAAFSATPTWMDSIEIKNAIIYFTNLSQNANSFIWNFGDGTTALFANGNHQYTDTGSYSVTLYAMNIQGCIDSVTVGPWVVMPDILYFIPNAFTPNDDGENDVFKIYGSGIKGAELIVFDRLGEKVFGSKDLATGWDGTFQGLKLNTGVFVYFAQLTLNNGVHLLLKGDVSLLR